MTGPQMHPDVPGIAKDAVFNPDTLAPATVDGLRLRKVMGRRTWQAPRRFGYDGWRMDRHDQTGRILISSWPEDDGREWTHASISHLDRLPDYDELAQLHLAVWGRAGWSYQVFAPEERHVNIHSHALHLWGHADGSPILPDFGARFGSI